MTGRGLAAAVCEFRGDIRQGDAGVLKEDCEVVEEIGGFCTDAIRGLGHGGQSGFPTLFDDLLGYALRATIKE